MKSQKMAGGNPKGSSHKPSPSSSHRKTRWEPATNPLSAHDSAVAGDGKPTKPSSSSKEDPAPGPNPNPGPSKLMLDGVPPSGPNAYPPSGAGSRFPVPEQADMGPPPPPPAYGFHMLERRPIVLADGNVRSYFALPPDYQDFPALGRPMGDSDRFLRFESGSHGPEPGGPGLWVNRRFHPGGPLSPEGFRHERFGRGGQFDYWNSLGPVPQEGWLKRKFGDEDERDGRDDFARQGQQLLHYGNPSSNPNGFTLGSGDYLAGTSSPFRSHPPLESGSGIDDLRSSKHMKVGGDYGNLPSERGVPGDFVNSKLPDVNPHALKLSFLRYVKKSFLKFLGQDVTSLKEGTLQCLACDREPKDFPDMHGLIMHAYNIQNPDSRVDHLGLHKALCVLMGWNYAKPPDNSKTYQSLSADEAAANKDDLIIWPPLVIIRNTNTGRGKGGRMEGMGNKVMDTKLRDLGFVGGKSYNWYRKDGHMGTTLIKFAGDQSGLKEAMRLAEFFKKDNHGREGWAHAKLKSDKDDVNNPNLVTVNERTGKKNKILYGYLGTASDLYRVDFETRNGTAIVSRKELEP